MKKRAIHSHFLASILIIFLGLFAVQCECQAGLRALEEEGEQKNNSGGGQQGDKPNEDPKPGLPKLPEITDEMIQYAESKGKAFLAEQLGKLQKEPPDKRTFDYIDKVNDNHITALCEAVAPGFNRSDIVKALLARGANPNFKDKAGDTVLSFAVPGNDPDNNLPTIKALVNAGADPSAGKPNDPPLNIAISATGKHNETIRFFISEIYNHKF